MKQTLTIRNEREYWEAREEAERLERACAWNELTNDEKNRLAQLSYATEQYEFRPSHHLTHSTDYSYEAR